MADETEVATLLHGRKKTVHAGVGYQDAQKLAAKRGGVKAMPEGELKEAVKHTEYIKAAVRSKIEHPFRVVKHQFG